VACLVMAGSSCGGDRQPTDALPGPPPPVSTVPGVDVVPVVGDSGDAGHPPASWPPGATRPPKSTGPLRTNGSETPGSTTVVPPLTTTTTLPPGLPPERCPDPKACRRGGYLTGSPLRWPTGPDGRATVHYRIHVGATTSKLTPEEMAAAVAAAFATWEAAAPVLRFVFDGFSPQPSVFGDRVNTVSFAPTGHAHTNISGTADGHMREADIDMGPGTYAWHPCEQRDGSCTRIPDDHRPDLQALATHEIGHLLGLADMSDPDLDRDLTMHPGGEYDNNRTARRQATLALGDVLWLRQIYPCSCPLPTIYAP
jgi:hypothetical protein